MTAHNSTRAVGVGANDQSKSMVDRTIIKPYFDHCTAPEMDPPLEETDDEQPLLPN